jgi:hypothetical protein
MKYLLLFSFHHVCIGYVWLKVKPSLVFKSQEDSFLKVLQIPSCNYLQFSSFSHNLQRVRAQVLVS